jgi:uncharacterized protein YkwD
MTFELPASRRAFLTRTSVTLIGMTALMAGCSTVGVLTPTPGATDQTEAALPMVNKLRAARGLPALSLNLPARKAAAEQAVRMAKAEKMTHLIGFNDSFLKRMKGRDVPLPAAENIASGQASVEAAVQAWIDSPKHLENMLGAYKGLGVAVSRTSAGRTYWGMVLSG